MPWSCRGLIYNYVCSCLSRHEKRSSHKRKSNGWKGSSSCTVQSVAEEDSSTDISRPPNDADIRYEHAIWDSWIFPEYSPECPLKSAVTAYAKQYNLPAIWGAEHLSPDSSKVHRDLESTEVGKCATTELEDDICKKRSLTSFDNDQLTKMAKTSLPDNDGSSYFMPFETKRLEVLPKERPKNPIKYLCETNIGSKGEKERVSFEEVFGVVESIQNAVLSKAHPEQNSAQLDLFSDAM